MATIEELEADPRFAELRGIILGEIAVRVGQVPDLHPRLLEGIEAAARHIADLDDLPYMADLAWHRVTTKVPLADRTDTVGVPWKTGDTVYEIKLEDGQWKDGQWEYRPQPFTVDGVDAQSLTVPDYSTGDEQ